MYYVLYNPMSNKGLSNKEVEKLVNQLKKEEEVEMVNKYIYRFAKENKENVIGSKEELEILLKL